MKHYAVTAVTEVKTSRYKQHNYYEVMEVSELRNEDKYN